VNTVLPRSSLNFDTSVDDRWFDVVGSKRLICEGLFRQMPIRRDLLHDNHPHGLVTADLVVSG
jgi:hypothetical protein